MSTLFKISNRRLQSVRSMRVKGLPANVPPDLAERHRPVQIGAKAFRAEGAVALHHSVARKLKPVVLAHAKHHEPRPGLFKEGGGRRGRRAVVRGLEHGDAAGLEKFLSRGFDVAGEQKTDASVPNPKHHALVVNSLEQDRVRGRAEYFNPRLAERKRRPSLPDRLDDGAPRRLNHLSGQLAAQSTRPHAQ